MRIGKIITAALAITLIGATASVAHPARGNFDRGYGIERQVDRQITRQVARQFNRAERRMDRRNYRADMRDFRRGRNMYRYDYNEFRRFQRGQRFHFNPHTHIVVNDWYRHRLVRPPRGYHWVRNGYSGDYILAAITTGIILNLMFDNHY